ncbi:hypothetical protein GCM10010465_24700 [Actinomadura fibrosa]
MHDSLFTKEDREINFADLKGWRFSPEDNPEFASPQYDDSSWYRLTKAPSQYNALPDTLWKGFGWFRLEVTIDPSFTTRTMFQSQDGSGAMEFFINDSIILRKGKPATTLNEQDLATASISELAFYDWEPGKTYQLAVRYSFHGYDTLKLLDNLKPPTFFDIHLFKKENLGLYLTRTKIVSLILGSSSLVLFMVMILHLFMYFKVKDKGPNFWIFILTITLFVFSVFLNIRALYQISSYPVYVAISFIMSFLIPLAIGLVPYTTHQVLRVEPHPFWRHFIWLGIVIPLLGSKIVVIYEAESVINPLIGLVLVGTAIFGGIQALRKAMKHTREDVGLIAVSILGLPVLLVLGIFLFDILELQNFSVTMVMYFLLLTVVPVGMSLYQGKRFLRMHNHLDGMVEERTLELEKAFQELEESHQNLKAAQNQLVQQEKLASLGQMTAGIAHEIKNPLNFVNNFSEVCIELIDEARVELDNALKEHRNSPDSDPNFSLLKNISELLDSVENNLQKIHQHGSRADGIVKAMLLHSRGGSGKQVPTDLNSLLKEYVNLAYHGMRAGKKPIEVEIELQLDDSLQEVSLISEDFSRVILNLSNNAFDALREKLEKKTFDAKLVVKTEQDKDLVRILFKDNGPGIPEENKNKILQPFFTTKKGTEGTGLGLSISHDIVKAHGGNILIESEPGMGTTFILELAKKPIAENVSS